MGWQQSSRLNPENVDETLVDVTVNPTTVDIEVSYDELVEQKPNSSLT